MQRSLHTKKHLLHGIVAFVLACNYFAFQVELFENEYDQNHPVPSGTSSISSYAANWESFDKDNAPQAFYFDAGIQIDCLLILQPPHVSESFPEPPFQPVRDKSPPMKQEHIAAYPHG